jgi:hypothetical protein
MFYSWIRETRHLVSYSDYTAAVCDRRYFPSHFGISAENV